MTATPEVNTFTTSTLELMTSLFGRLGVHGEDAALAFHSYDSFMIGAVPFAAERQSRQRITRRQRGPRPIPPARQPASTAIDPHRHGLFDTAPACDEALLEQGLRRLVRSLTA